MYLLIGATNALLIDTGLGVDSIGGAIREQPSLLVVTTDIYCIHIGE